MAVDVEKMLSLIEEVRGEKAKMSELCDKRCMLQKELADVMDAIREMGSEWGPSPARKELWRLIEGDK